MMLFKYLLFALAGFFSGSTMYSYLIPKHFCNVDTVEEGSDHNPGATNAILCAGKGVGILCPFLDILKGFVPVFLARLLLGTGDIWFAFIIVAPVAGHAFSPFMGFKGGKAIATSCGVLAALFPESLAVVWLVLIMTLFSLIVVIKPDSLRMIISMLLLCGMNIAFTRTAGLEIGISVLSAIVIYKHLRNYGDEKKKVRLFFQKK